MVDYFGHKLSINSKEKERKYYEEISDYGYYPYKIDESAYDDFINNERAVNEVFIELMKQRLEKWIKIAENELADKLVIVNAGNDDPFELDSVLDSSHAIIHPEGKVVKINGYELISTGYANMTPWHAPRDVPEEVLREKIEDMASKLKEPRRSIFNIHPPPFNTGLDLAPKVDGQLRPLTLSGMPIMEPVGSKAVREMLEIYQPMLGLHGHVHESRAAKMFKSTLIINPGSDCQHGALLGALIVINDGIITNYMLTNG